MSLIIPTARLGVSMLVYYQHPTIFQAFMPVNFSKVRSFVPKRKEDSNRIRRNRKVGEDDPRTDEEELQTMDILISCIHSFSLICREVGLNYKVR